MASFYVVNGKRFLLTLVVVILVIVAIVWGLKPGTLENVGDTTLSLWAQFAPEPVSQEGEDGSDQSEPALQVTASYEPELDSESQIVTVRPVPTRFSEYRLERERVRSRRIELLDSIASDTSINDERRTNAQRELMELMNYLGKEAEVENLLKAKGYLDAIAILEDNSVTVAVPVTLTREEASSIGDVVTRITGVSRENITIVDEPAQQEDLGES